MATALTITETLVRDAIAKAVANVFRTMVRRDAVLRPEPQLPADASFELLASVGFVGEANGVIYLCLSQDFTRFVTGEVLGLAADDETLHDQAVLKDAIGEIANMTVGGFKNQLCDSGMPCKLTLPTIVFGEELKVRAVADAVRHIYAFDCAGHVLVADIQLRAG